MIDYTIRFEDAVVADRNLMDFIQFMLMMDT